MKQNEYQRIEQEMRRYMTDIAHDQMHVYRVLNAALIIAAEEPEADRDLLMTACLLHDIGRQKQYADPTLCHALEGGKMAEEFLLEIGWSGERAAAVRACIESHRYRGGHEPQGIEAKILFDADKLDATGAIGITRTLMYQGIVGDPLYHVDENGVPMDENDRTPSFFREYHYKLKNVYDQFYTKAGARMARENQQAAVRFYEALRGEVFRLHPGEILNQQFELDETSVSD